MTSRHRLCYTTIAESGHIHSAATFPIQPEGRRMEPQSRRVTIIDVARHAQVSTTAWDVTYRLPAVGGSWDFTDNGRYDLIVTGNQVRDLNSPSSSACEDRRAPA